MKIDILKNQTPLRFFPLTFSLCSSLHSPTPAGWLLGWTLLYLSRACLSEASWPVFPLACALLTLARLGVNGFGHFDRNQSGSAAGPNPGTHQIPLHLQSPKSRHPTGPRLSSCLDAWLSPIHVVEHISLSFGKSCLQFTPPDKYPIFGTIQADGQSPTLPPYFECFIEEGDMMTVHTI